MANIQIAKNERDAKCRICEETIPRGSDAVKLENIHVSPNTVNLWFHIDCIFKENGAYDGPSMPDRHTT